ncbi:centrosome-associated protein ALMS1 isoform X2 [Camelus bactrianus]|uniref:Centrosome-associated protein ALMS1 isoform X2 n=1 Tax=Camelus bactrianus TaxID=9837 RepID=A0AC58NI13_CAMBA
MEPEDLPWPGELEEEEEEEEEEEAEEAENLEEDEVVMVEEVEEEEGRRLDADFNFESQRRESTDDEDDEEAKAWLQAHPGGSLPPPSLPRHRYSEGELSRPEQRTESWHLLPQETDSSHTLDTTQTRFSVREEGTEVTDFPSLEEGTLTQSENQVKEHDRDLLCSPLLVIQDSFASPDLPLLTCLTKDPEFGPDSLFHQSELDFASLREIPGKPEDTEWFSRPSEVSEALFQAASDVASDLEGLQGKAESDIYTLDDDTECCSLDENAVECSKRVAGLQREICDQGDLRSECIELAGLETLLDDLEICDSSLHWQSTVQLPSKEESESEEPVDHSNVDINQSFSSVSPPFFPHKPTRELEYHSSDLRMLRVSPDTVPRTLKHLTGDTSKGGIAEIPQPNLKPGITTTPEDSDIGSHLSLSPEDFPRLAVRSPQVKTIGQYTDILNQQALADGHLIEETLKVSAVPELADQKTGIASVPFSSSSQRGKPSIFYPQALPDNHLTAEALKVSTVPGLGDQKTGIPTVPPNSYSLGEKYSIFYPQALPGSHQTEEALKVSVVPGSADQKTGIQTVPASSYSVGEKPGIFYQPALPGSYPSEEALKVSASPRPAEQKTGIPTTSPTSYLHGEKPSIFYQKTLPESHLTKQALKVSAAPGPPEQKTGIPTVTSTSYAYREKPSILYQQELPDSHPIQQVKQDSAAPGPLEQKTGTSTVPSTSYAYREKPSILHQQELPDSHPIQQVQQDSAAPGPPEQKTGIPTVTSTSYAYREKPSILYQQELPDSHLIEQVQKVSAAPGFAEQKTGISTVPSTSYSHREKPSILYQQELPDSHPIQQVQQDSAAPGPPEQKTGIPTATSTSYAYRGKPNILYQQELRDSHLIEQAQKVSAAPGFAEQKTGISTVPSTSYSDREKPSILYQQELPDSHPIQQVQQASAAPGPPEQKTGIPTATSASYAYRGKPNILYQQELRDSHFIEQAQKVSAAPGFTEQETGISTVPSTSYSHREKPSILYQELPDSHPIHQVQQDSAAPGPPEQKTGIPTATSASYAYREKPSILYQQELRDSHFIEQAQKVSAAPGFAEQETGISTVPSTSYSHREKPSILYQQELPDSHPIHQVQQASAAPGPPEQKTGTSTVPSTSYSYREKPSILYQQELRDSHLIEQAQKVSAAPGFAEQETGISTVPSTSYSHREKPSILYQQELPDSHLTKEAQRVPATPGLGHQKTGVPIVPPAFFSHRGKTSFSYQQELPDSHLKDQTQKISAILGPVDQDTGLQTVPSSSYAHREKPIIFYQQKLPGSHLTEEALKVSAVAGPADPKTGISESSRSYSHREKSSIFYQQELPDSHPTEEALKVSGISETGDQKTGIPTVTSTSYSHKEKPIIFYQQALPDSQLTVEALKVSGVPGPADQKTGISTVPSSSSSYREKPIISYQQEFPDLTQVALKVLEVPGPADQKIGIPAVTSTYSRGEKPIISYEQELSDSNKDALELLGVPGQADQNTGMQTVPPTSCSHRESPMFSYQKELPDITEETLKVSAVPGPSDQKTGIRTSPSSSYSYREKPDGFYQQELPNLTEEALKVFALPGPADQNTEIPTGPSSSFSHKEKLKISTVILPDEQKTELPLAPTSSYSHREKPKTSAVIGLDSRKTPLLTVFRNSYSQRVNPSIFFRQQLPDRRQSEDILKISPVPEPTDVNPGIAIPLSSSYSHREKSDTFYPQELPDQHQTEDVLKVSTVPGPADQKIVLPSVPPSSFSHREKPVIFYQQDLPERHLTEDDPKSSSSLGQADQITGLSTVPPDSYSYSEKHKLVSDHVQRLIDNLESSNSSVISSNVPLNSQADSRIVINKPESSGFEDVGTEEIRGMDSGSKTLKEIRTLLMEAENIALRRYNFPVPLVPFRDVSDISFIQSKKVVCFKEPPTTDESNGDLSHRQPFTEESPNNKCTQKDISTQTNLKCQRGIENWEFISSTAVRSPVQEAESKTRVTLDETLRQYKAAKSVMRSEPEGYSGTIGNKIVIPMMTIIKSDSSSDASSCSWDSNSLESVSDVLNFLPRASPKTSVTDSREEEGVLESDDGGGSSVDSLAAHVKNLLKCESSLNHAKQILRNAEEEESRVRARAWNLKFNMAHDCGYSISELNEDDRRKVEEIKAKLFGHGRTTDLSKGLQSPRGIGCKSEAVCSHIIIESHEKGCFRTLTAEQPQLDSHPYVFRPAESSEMIRRRQWSPSLWRTRHINLSKSSLDQSNSHFRVWNSSQLQSHSPFQHFTANDLKISEGLRMPFRENLDPWLSELVEPTCMPPEETDYHSSPQALPPEPMKKFTTSITFSSHRHSNCFSDSSFLKVGVTEGSQCTGGSVGVFNSHFTEEQNPPRDLKQKTSSPSSCKIISQSPGKAVTILAESSRQSQKLSVEHSHQEVKLLERSDFKDSHSKPSSSANGSSFKEVHSSDNPTLVSISRPSSTLGTKEKNITITPDLPSHTFLEQQEFFEQSRAPHADHHVRKHSPPPQHQNYVAPKLPCRIFLEKQELSEQRKAPHVDHQVRENHSPLPQRQDYIAPDLPSSIFLEQRQLFEQSKAPDIDPMKKHHAPLAQGQDYVVEKNNQQKPKLHVSDMINVEAKSNNVVSPSIPDQCTVITSTFIPPSNRKALSYVRITLCPKTPSKLDSGTLDKRFHSLDPASKTRMNSEFNSDLQTVSSRSLEPTSKLLTSKPIAQDQESLGFLGPKSSPDFQVVQSPLPDSNIITQDLKTIPFQNSQIVTSRQTQVNISDLEGYSSPEGTPVSADRSSREIKAPVSSFSGKMSSDAVTQITTESPGKAIFSSEIFVNAKDRGHQIPETSTQKLGNVPVRFASSSSVQQITVSNGTNDQPSLLPYKPSGTMKMYYVPQLKEIPSLSLDSKSDTTIESSHSGSNDAIAPDFPAQVLGTRNDDLADTVNIKHKEGIYSKRVVSKAPSSVGKKPFQKDHADAQVQVLITSDENLSEKNQEKEIYSKRVVTEAVPPEEESLQKNTTVSSDATVSELSAQLQDVKTGNIPDTKAIEQKEEIQSKRTVPKEAWPKESRCHSEYENTTHSVFKSAKFYFHHPVHLPSDQDFCHESLGRSVFMRHSWKDLFQRHSDKQREHTCLPPPYQNVEKTKTDYTRVESLSINVNLENKEVKHTTKSQARDYPKSDKQVDDPKKDDKASPQLTTQHPVSLNELWNKFQERQRQQKPPVSGKKELSLVERLDRLAKLLQHPITYSLQTSESTQDESREEQDVKGWTGRQQQQKHKLQKKKRYKSLEKYHKNTGDLKRSKVLSTHQAERSNQIKIEQIKFDKYILRKQPGFHCNLNNTSSDSRPSEESDLFTDTTTNILSTTTSPVESDILTQTDKELALHERSSSVSTIDTARLIHAFGHDRVCLSPRRTKLYSSITDHQRRYLEKQSKKYKKALNTRYPQITSEHTRRKHIQVTDHISSDSVSSSTSSFWNSTSTFCIKQNVHMLNKGVQAGNLEIVNGVRKHTRDVGMTFPTPSSSKTRVEEDSDVTSWSEEKIEEKKLLTNCIGDKKLRKNKQSCCEGVSWFVPVENVKSVPKKENLPMLHGPGVAWFAPITSTKPWREPLREQNWQGQPMDSPSSLAGLGREPPKPFVRVTLQESLHLHRPDFISRSGERIKRLKLIVQERKMQNMLQSERDALFNTGRGWQGCRGPVHPLLPKRGFLAAQKKRPIGKKEMIQRSKRIYEQLPEVQKKREEEKRRSEYKSYRLRAQLYKKKVTNQLLGRKVPWD